jgi:hypothetical protein
MHLLNVLGLSSIVVSISNNIAKEQTWGPNQLYQAQGHLSFGRGGTWSKQKCTTWVDRFFLHKVIGSWPNPRII